MWMVPHTFKQPQQQSVTDEDICTKCDTKMQHDHAHRNAHVTKKLSCRKETARCFVLLNISLSHLRSLKVIWNDTLEYRACVILKLLSSVNISLVLKTKRTMEEIRIHVSTFNVKFDTSDKAFCKLTSLL